jgi:GNAT superfamily N-acetyltransferase
VEVDVEKIPAAASYPLRHAVLRTHQAIDEVGFPADNDPGAATFGAIDRADGNVVAVVTVFREPPPFDTAAAGVPTGVGSEATTWRLRAMATREDLRGKGLGSLVLSAALDHVASEGGDLIWCYARLRAVGFYERAGFKRWGDEWDVPFTGPHVVMWRTMDTREAT